MYNILINNLSTVRSNVTCASKYRLAIEEETDDRLFEGIYTNEPITHALVHKFVTEDQGEKLDLVYSLTTETVRNGRIFRNAEGNECSKFYAGYLDLTEKEVLQFTHYEFYKELIHKIRVDEYCLQSKDELAELDGMDLGMTLEDEQISNNPGTKEIHSVVLAMATKIIELYDIHQGQCRLYMDYTGGDRTVSTVMIALTKMLEERGIIIDHIWAVVGFNSTQINLICEKIEVNYIFDLISGLQEFNRYGKADILNEFLRKSEKRNSIVLSEPARKVQEKIQSLADKIQLCRSNDIIGGIGELVNSIKDYEKKDVVNDQMFNYLISDIRNNYAQIYESKNRTIPNIISWCLDKNLIQQAVTMYAELLPEVIIKSKILYYDKNNWNEVEENLLCIENNKRKSVEFYKNEVHNYICFGTCDRNKIKNGSKSQKTGYKSYKEEYSFINYYIWNEIAERAGYEYNSSHHNLDRIKCKAELITNFVFSDGNQSPYTQTGKGISRKEMKGLLTNYMIFKTEIRHTLNHAAGKFSLRNLHESMVWEDNTRIAEAFEGKTDMTVQLLTEIMRDILLQLNGMISRLDA